LKRDGREKKTGVAGWGEKTSSLLFAGKEKKGGKAFYDSGERTLKVCVSMGEASKFSLFSEKKEKKAALTLKDTVQGKGNGAATRLSAGGKAIGVAIKG